LSSLILGTGTNLLQVDTLTIGSGKNNSGMGTGMVKFASQTAGSAGSVTISNKAGTGAATIVIGETASGETTSGAGGTGTLDLRGHVATVSSDIVRIGRNAMGSNSGSTDGKLYFDAGTFTVTTLNIAPKINGGTGNANATVNVGGGSFTVNSGGTFTLGSQSGNGKSFATLNLTGGVFTSNVDILDGGGTSTSTINLNGGTLDLTGHALGSSSVAIDALNFNSGTLKNVSQINNGAGLTKATAGTLILDGTNSYSGATTVSAGTLLVNGVLGNTDVTVGANGTIGGSGSLGGALTFGAGAKLDLTGATIGLTSTDILSVASGKTITLTDFAFSNIIGWDWLNAAEGTYTLINGGGTISLAGTTPTESSPFDFENGKSGYFQAGSLQVVIIPEPRAALLGGLGMLALLRRRR
jgi:autotransporter-associated beta strand protein